MHGTTTAQRSAVSAASTLLHTLHCFTRRCQLTDPGGVSNDWEAQARVDAVPASACKRSGHLLPPRARYVRRAGRVIVGFDHWCHWLDTPIGAHMYIHHMRCHWVRTSYHSRPCSNRNTTCSKLRPHLSRLQPNPCRLPQPEVLRALRALLSGLLHHGRRALVVRIARAGPRTPRPLATARLGHRLGREFARARRHEITCTCT